MSLIVPVVPVVNPSAVRNVEAALQPAPDTAAENVVMQENSPDF